MIKELNLNPVRYIFSEQEFNNLCNFCKEYNHTFRSLNLSIKQHDYKCFIAILNNFYNFNSNYLSSHTFGYCHLGTIIKANGLNVDDFCSKIKMNFFTISKFKLEKNGFGLSPKKKKLEEFIKNRLPKLLAMSKIV